MSFDTDVKTANEAVDALDLSGLTKALNEKFNMEEVLKRTLPRLGFLFDGDALAKQATAMLVEQRHKVILEAMGIDFSWGRADLKGNGLLKDRAAMLVNSIVDPIVDEQCKVLLDPTTESGKALRAKVAPLIQKMVAEKIGSLQYYVQRSVTDRIDGMIKEELKARSEEISKALVANLAQFVQGITLPPAEVDDGPKAKSASGSRRR